VEDTNPHTILGIRDVLNVVYTLGLMVRAVPVAVIR